MKEESIMYLCINLKVFKIDGFLKKKERIC